MSLTLALAALLVATPGTAAHPATPGSASQCCAATIN